MPRRAVIIGTGMAVPERILTNADLEKMVETSDEWIVSRTGIRERRIADENTASSDLGYLASMSAIEKAGIDPAEIDIVIVSTVTPDMIFPATACLIQHKIGAINAAAYDLEAGCTGWCYALACGSAFLESGMYKTALIIGVDILTKITDWEDRKTCVLFGDGAGAVVIRAEEGERGVLQSMLGSDGSGGEKLCLPAGGSLKPATQDTLDKRLHYMQMEGQEVYKFGVRIMNDVVPAAIEKAGISPEDIKLYIPHQANIRIIEGAAKRLKVDMDRMYVNIDRYGNTSSASIPLALSEAVDKKLVQPGDLIMTIGFGAGFTYGTNLIRM